MEAKALGTDLNNGKIVKQLCTYLGEMGVQWGLLTDGNKYIMYNSSSGASFEDQRFLTMQIKTADTEDGISFEDLAEKLIALLSRRSLEKDEVQSFYESHIIDRHIEDALSSILLEPFDTLALAIKKEFKEDRVKVGPNVKITQKQIISYLERIKDEDGRIPIDMGSANSNCDEEILHHIALSQEKSDKGPTNIKEFTTSKKIKRITISDLLKNKFVSEGDSWRFEYKGEFTWGRITGNGEIEINGKTYTNPSRAGSSITNKSCGGWTTWSYRDTSGKWYQIKALRGQYQEKYETLPSIKQEA